MTCQITTLLKDKNVTASDGAVKMERRKLFDKIHQEVINEQ